MKAKLSLGKTLCLAAAAALSVTAFAGCGAGGNAAASSSSKGFDAAFDYAKSQVSSYSSMQSRYSAVFADEAFSKANATAMLLDGKTAQEDLEKAARYLFLDSITVCDETGKVVASYPEGEAGKSIKEISDKAYFNRVVKGVVVKTMTDPVLQDDCTYTVMTGVTRADGSGAVVIGFTTDEYTKVNGADVAKSCGVNTVVLKDGAVISATLDGVKAGDVLDTLGVKTDDVTKGSFDMKVGDASYSCKAATIDNYIVICAEPK